MTHPIDEAPRRICWLLHGDEGYGVQRAVLNLMAGIARAGHTPMAVLLDDGPMAIALQNHGTEIIRGDFGRVKGLTGTAISKLSQLQRNRRDMPHIAGRLAKCLHGRQIDVIHFLAPTHVDLGARVANSIGALPVWEMANTVGANLPLRLSRLFFQWTCWRHRVLVLANSGYTGKTLGSWPIQPVIFHLGVDPLYFDPAAVDAVSRSELGIPESAIVLAVVARIHPAKGQDLVIAAMHDLYSPPSRPLHLLLLGGARDTSYCDRLRDLIRSKNLESRVHLLGNVADPHRYYPAIDIPINSRINPEPFGLSVVEALMMARPPLVYALGGPAETVLDGTTGWHLREPTARCLAAGLRRAVGDEESWPRMRAAARAHALAHFTIEKQTERYLTALTSVDLRGKHEPSGKPLRGDVT